MKNLNNEPWTTSAEHGCVNHAMIKKLVALIPESWSGKARLVITFDEIEEHR